MCEFLINAKNPISDHPMAYQRGDIFDAFPDGTWTKDSHIPDTWVGVIVPDMTLEEGKLLCSPHEEIDSAGNVITALRRRFFCAEHIAPDNITEFYRCVVNCVPYTTDRISFLSYAVEDKL